MTDLSRALAIASEAHAGQVDKAGEPYILHPLRVMLAMKTDEERIVAVLHDVVEDTDWTLAQLSHAGFSASTVDAVDALTRRGGEAYDAYIERVGAMCLARHVKMMAIQDNLSPKRKASLPSDLEERYRKAFRSLAMMDL